MDVIEAPLSRHHWGRLTTAMIFIHLSRQYWRDYAFLKQRIKRMKNNIDDTRIIVFPYRSYDHVIGDFNCRYAIKGDYGNYQLLNGPARWANSADIGEDGFVKKGVDLTLEE